MALDETGDDHVMSIHSQSYCSSFLMVHWTWFDFEDSTLTGAAIFVDGNNAIDYDIHSESQALYDLLFRIPFKFKT
jgi:hypothetical protein